MVCHVPYGSRLAVDGDHGARDGQPGVGGQDAALDDPGRLERVARLLVTLRPVGLEVDHLPGVARVADGEGHTGPAADAGHRRPPPVVGLHRPRPGAHPRRRVRPEPDALEQAAAQPPDELNADLDAPGRRAGHIDQPDADRLLGPERDLGPGPFGVGVQLDPAQPVSRRGGQREDLGDAGRRRAGRIQAIAAVAIGLAPDQQGPRIRIEIREGPGDGHVRMGQDVHDRAPDRPAVGIEHAAGDGHPGGSGGIGLRHGFGLIDAARATFAAGAAGSLTGSSVIAMERASQSAPVATAARSIKDIAVSLSLWISMDLRTSWASAAAGAESAPPAAA